MAGKLSFSLLAPQKGVTGLSLRPYSCCVLLEGTRRNLESDIKATTDSHRKYLAVGNQKETQKLDMGLGCSGGGGTQGTSTTWEQKNRKLLRQPGRAKQI